MVNAKYYFAIKDKKCFIKLIGSINYSAESPFRSFIIKVLKEDLYDEFVINLDEVNYIDSINLGVISKISHDTRVKNGQKPIIFSTSKYINIILNRIELNKVFIIINDIDNKYENERKYTNGSNLTKKEFNKRIYDYYNYFLELNNDIENNYHDINKFMEDK